MNWRTSLVSVAQRGCPLALSLLLALPALGAAQVIFSPISFSVSDFYVECISWGDVDGDGDKDLLLTGEPSITTNRYTRLFINEGNDNFSEKESSLPDVWRGCAVFEDYNNDGRVDIAIIGYRPHSNDERISAIYRNEQQGVFVNITAPLAPLSNGTVTWMDFDNDGWKDLLLTGTTQYNSQTGALSIATKLYSNKRGDAFEEVAVTLPAVTGSTVATADYDLDGYQDVFIAGCDQVGCPAPLAALFHNNGGYVFSEISTGLPGFAMGSADFGDFDKDGKPDLLVSGVTSGTMQQAVFDVFRNQGGGAFAKLPLGLPSIWAQSVHWGDYNADGYYDLLASGNLPYSNEVTTIFKNMAGISLQDSLIQLGQMTGKSGWIDHDNDGDLDIMATGYATSDRGGQVPEVRIYKNLMRPQIRGVFTENGNPLSGITVKLGGAFEREVTTGSDGGYVFSDLDPGIYTVSVLHQRFSFDPASSTVDLRGKHEMVVNFDASSLVTVGISVNEGAQYTKDRNVTLDIVEPLGATKFRISNDGGFRNFAEYPVSPSIPWILSADGTEKLPKIVYVRFYGPGVDGEKSFSDDIILDETAPIVTAASATVVSKKKPKPKELLYKVTLKARDAISGLSGLQISASKTKGGKIIPYSRTTRIALKKNAGLWVRVLDKAGNPSNWKKILLRR